MIAVTRAPTITTVRLLELGAKVRLQSGEARLHFSTHLSETLAHLGAQLRGLSLELAAHTRDLALQIGPQGCDLRPQLST
jgi:hypothetical protein